ncbi:MAG: AAA family ATPase [Planctomycetaceae bacterium]|jgi:predicted AAA+ superfamily ATPase|nr:AAA family ATPase [Planctomycetaceae bacterium]
MERFNIERKLNLQKTLERKSVFLFGPRQTGKSWLIRQTLGKELSYNLLDSDVMLKLSRSPNLMREEMTEQTQLIVIDEVQRLPQLLETVHLMIEEYGVRFLLTSSSARKLRRGGVNLLGGRALQRNLHPFVMKELEDRFDLLKSINIGLLPSIYFSKDAVEDLKAYTGVYLKEEIAAEGLTRNLPAFSRFLTVAALCNARQLNISKIANDAQVARTTIQEYFGILRDTLIGYELPAWRETVKRKAAVSSKFYLFDTGVARILQNRSEIHAGTPEFGDALETYFCHELRSYADYCGGMSLHYWRSTTGYEVDFILDGRAAIEVKGTGQIQPCDLKPLRALREENLFEKYIVVSMDDRPRQIDGIRIYPWRQFLAMLWNNEI